MAIIDQCYRFLDSIDLRALIGRGGFQQVNNTGQIAIIDRFYRIFA